MSKENKSAAGEAPPRVIAALPAFNEERYIGSLVLKARQYADEVIVCDDGSTDGTAEIAQLAGATVLKHAANRGKGTALQDILAVVREKCPEVLVLLDGDGQHNPDEIPVLVKAIREGYDLVIGSRKAQAGKTPFYRRMGQSVISHYSAVLSGNGRIKDTESGFRALSSRAMSAIFLKENGFAAETEMIVQAEGKGLKLTEVPVSNIYTLDGSTLNPVQHGISVLGRIMTMISERRPLFFFSLFGLIMAVLGLAAGIRVLDLFAVNRELPVGTTILAAIFLIVSVFSFFTGIILHILTGTLRSVVESARRESNQKPEKP